jgi:hypothetical protein
MTNLCRCGFDLTGTGLAVHEAEGCPVRPEGGEEQVYPVGHQILTPGGEPYDTPMYVVGARWHGTHVVYTVSDTATA